MLNFFRAGVSCLTVFSLVLIMGCGLFSGSGQVEGVVYLNGEPTGGFEVILTPSRRIDSGVAYYGTAAEQGKFRVSQGKGNFLMPAGEYKVTFATIPVSDNIPVLELNMPAKYTDPSQAEYTVQVVQGKNQFEFRLEAEVQGKGGRKQITE